MSETPVMYDEKANPVTASSAGQDFERNFDYVCVVGLQNRLKLERDRNALLRRENVKLWKDIDLLQRSLEVARKACATHEALIALLEESMSQTCEECGVKTAVPYMHKGLCPRCTGKAYEADPCTEEPIKGDGKEPA